MASIVNSNAYNSSTKKSISGTVSNQSETLTGYINKNIERVAYGGGETDTLKVTVDNDKHIITGDVKWQAFLGETDTSAYRGSSGAFNRARIIELAEALSQEIKRAVSIENSLGWRIDTESHNRIEFNKDILARLYEIESVVVKSLKDDTDALRRYVDDAIEMTSVVSNNLDILNKSLSEDILEESNRAKLEEHRLLEFIEKEGDTRLSEDTSIRMSIEQLKSSAKDTVSNLNLEIKAVDNRVTDANEKIDEVEISIEGLSDKMNDDYDRVQRLISDTKKKIDDETYQRIESDVSIRNLIAETSDKDKSHTNERVDTLKSYVDSSDATIESSLTSLINTSINDVNSSIDDVSRSLVTVSKELSNERADRISKDLDIANSIAKLEEDVNVNVSSKINELADYVKSEISTAIDDLTTSDELLADKIDEESLRAISSEESIIKDISNFRRDYNDTVNQLSNNDNELSSSISLLTDEVDNKFNRLTLEDEVITSRINDVSTNLFNDIRYVENKSVAKIEDESDSLYIYSHQDGKESKMIADVEPKKDSIVVRDSTGRVVLIDEDDDIYSLLSNNAVPKLYVDMSDDSTYDKAKKYIDAKLDVQFIDGGNAPISND